MDPGGTSGLVLVHDWELTYVQLGPGDHHKALVATLAEAQPHTLIVEGYKRRRQAGELVSIEYIGICKLHAQIHNCGYEEQDPAQGKAFWTNDKLKQLGLYKPAMPHAMDALRHFLYWTSFTLHDNRYLNQLPQSDDGKHLEGDEH